MRELLTAKELNEKLPFLSLWCINELRRRGVIPYVKVPGIKKFLFDLEAVNNWLKKSPQQFIK